MKRYKASREGTLVYLPKYVNAEMLMLKFLEHDTVGITPQGTRIDGKGAEFTLVQVHLHVVILDQLVDYINANI